LIELARQKELPLQLVPAVRAGNNAHKNWPRRRLQEMLHALKGTTIAIWGLTYKPGTDTLRRSSSIELCQWLLGQGAKVRAHDPAVKALPEQYAGIRLCGSPLEAAQGADALVIATEWPDYLAVSLPEVLAVMRSPIILDANRFLGASTESLSGLKYAAVGKAVEA